MGFSSIISAPSIEPALARTLLLAHVPRRLRLCLMPALRLNVAQLGIAGEVTTLVPDAAGLAATWVEAADASAGALWLDPRFANAAAALTGYLDALAVTRDLPALASLADAVVLLSRPGEDRAAAARLAPSVWMENHLLAEVHLIVEPTAMSRARMAVGLPGDAVSDRNTPDAASAAATAEEDDEDGETLDRRRDAEAALERAWSMALDTALLDLRADATAVVAGLATLAGGAGDDHLNGLGLVLAAIEVGHRLVVPVEERVRQAESARRQTLTRRLDRMETELRQAKAAAASDRPSSAGQATADPERHATGASKPAVTAVREGYLLAVPPVQESPADKSRNLVRGYEAIVGKALPLVATTDLTALRTELIGEFPYAHAAIEALLSDLGARYVRLHPTILVGLPGCGKSRLAHRFAERLGLGPWRVDGSHDGASFLGGTDRRWTSAEPAHALMAMNRFGIANPMILIDEIEKAATRTDHGRLWDALLVMLEPETARHYMDPAFQVEVDLSQVSWLATANTTKNLPGPLLDRMRVVEVPSPGPADLPALLPRVLVGIARARGHDPRFLEALDGEERRAVETAWRGGSVRRLTRVVEAIVAVRGKVALRH